MGRECSGNQAKAARALGLSYYQYRYFLRKFADKEPAEAEA